MEQTQSTPNSSGGRETPRLPTNEERQQLIPYIKQNFELDHEEATDLVDHTAITVFDRYMTNTPGFAGKLMMVVWPGSPAYYDVYTWDETDRIQHQE